MVEYETKDGRLCKGVTTNWLLDKAVADDLKPTVPIYIRKTQFRLPFKFQTSIIMIGPGTGLAPFRGTNLKAWPFFYERVLTKYLFR